MVLDLEALLDPLHELAEDAGRRIMQFFHEGYDVEHKRDNTPVTQADFAANSAILAGLAVLTPELPVISEESPIPAFATRKNWETFWLVDPLDGTREFINGREGFSVNIALIHQHEPVAGVIHAPASGVSYYACRGSGAFRKSRDHQVPVPIHTRRTIQQPPVIAVSRSRHGERIRKYLQKLGEHETIYIGSSLKSCLVAEGKADLYPCLGPTSEWDTAAAQVIVEEAGGSITDTRLQALRYNTKESLLNPEFLVYGDHSINWSDYL